MEGRHQLVSLAVAIAPVLVATIVGVVRTDEVDVVNEVPLQEVLAVSMRVTFPKFVFSGWISMESFLMAKSRFAQYKKKCVFFKI